MRKCDLRISGWPTVITHLLLSAACRRGSRLQFVARSYDQSADVVGMRPRCGLESRQSALVVNAPSSAPRTGLGGVVPNFWKRTSDAELAPHREAIPPRTCCRRVCAKHSPYVVAERKSCAGCHCRGSKTQEIRTRYGPMARTSIETFPIERQREISSPLGPHSLSHRCAGQRGGAKKRRPIISHPLSARARAFSMSLRPLPTTLGTGNKECVGSDDTSPRTIAILCMCKPPSPPGRGNGRPSLRYRPGRPDYSIFALNLRYSSERA